MPAREQEPLNEYEREEIINVLARFWPTRPKGVAEIRVLSGGYLNRSYLILNGATRYVLRNYKFNPQPESIAYEHDLLQYLPAEINQAMIAKPLCACSGDTLVSVDGHYYGLFPYVDGAPFGHGNARLLESAGRTLASYHNAVREYLPKTQQRPTYGTVAQLDWVARHCSSLEELWHSSKLLGISNQREAMICDGIDFLAREARQIEKALGNGAYASLPLLVIHNDFGPQNLLRVGDDIVGILDFDLAAWDARIFDLATALTWLGEDVTLSPPYATLPGDRKWVPSLERSRAVFRGYTADIEVPLSGAEINILSWMLRAFGMWLAVWYLDLRLAGKEWYPEEVAGLLAYLKWLCTNSNGYARQIVSIVDC